MRIFYLFNFFFIKSLHFEWYQTNTLFRQIIKLSPGFVLSSNWNLRFFREFGVLSRNYDVLIWTVLQVIVKLLKFWEKLERNGGFIKD